MSPEPKTAPPTFAWCFSHGRMHTFRPTEADPKPWCTATWMPLNATTEEAALAEKQERYGDARFDHHLPPEQRWHVIEVCALRYGYRGGER